MNISILKNNEMKANRIKAGVRILGKMHSKSIGSKKPILSKDKVLTTVKDDKIGDYQIYAYQVIG